jgi:hypothetical protein
VTWGIHHGSKRTNARCAFSPSSPNSHSACTPSHPFPKPAFADEPLDASAEEEAAHAQAALLLLGPPGSRAERLADYIAGWLQHHIFASRAPLPTRCRAVTAALRALSDLTAASRFQLPDDDHGEDGVAGRGPFGPAPFAVGALPWGLSSPWRALAEGRTEAHSTLPGSGATRLWLAAGGGRHAWREGTEAPAPALAGSRDGMRPAIAGLRLPPLATAGGGGDNDDDDDKEEEAMDVDRGRKKRRRGERPKGGLPPGRDRLCTAGGRPLLRRQGRGAQASASSSSSSSSSFFFSSLSSSSGGSGAAQLGAARRVLAHMDGWVEALTAALGGGAGGGAASGAHNDESVRYVG